MAGGNLVEVGMGAIDRISELPDFIKHIILSVLDTKEAGRASVLSKRWYLAWSSIPVLDFHPKYFKVTEPHRDPYHKDKVRRFVGFIDKTMQRYSRHKYRITKMYLEFPVNDEKLETMVDKWIMIAVQSEIQNLEVQITGYDYRLPEILFCAKSLRVLKCMFVELSYHETMELISLEYLTLHLYGVVDEDMLQRIISLCPLVELDITNTGRSLKSVSLPWMRGVESRGGETKQSNILTSPLQKFAFTDITINVPWPWKINVVTLKNLRTLEIFYATITDDVVSELAYGLIALESLVLNSCSKLKCINI